MTLGSLYIEAQGYVPVLLENFRGISGMHSPGLSHSGSVSGSWVVLGFSVDMEVFDELLLINVPWSQEFSGVHRIWT